MSLRLSAEQIAVVQHEATEWTLPGLNVSQALDDPTKISDEVKQEIIAVFYKNGEARSAKETQAELHALMVSLKSRLIQAAESQDGVSIWHGCPEEEFRRAPRTPEKTLQEVLTAPPDRKVFKKPESPEDEGKGIPVIRIDPRRITDRLLENLGLSHRIPRKISRDEKIQRYAEAIPDIQVMLQHLSSIRIFPRTKASPRFFKINGPHPFEGYLLGAQEIHQQDRLFRTDMYGGARRFQHIRTSYQGELERLEEIQRNFRQIHEALGLWRKGWSPERKRALKSLLEQKLLDEIEALVFVSDPYKVRLSCMARTALQMLELPNPSAAQGAMYLRGKTGVFGLIQGRIESIQSIQRQLVNDEDDFVLLHAEEQGIFSNLFKTIEAYRERLRIIDPKKPLTSEDRERIIENLHECRKKLEGIHFQPNLAFAKAMIPALDRCIACLREETPENRKEAAHSFVQLFLFAKVKEWYEVLHKKFYPLISDGDPKYLHVGRAFQLLEDMVELVTRRRVAPHIATPEFDHLWGKIHSLLHALRRDLGDYKKTASTKEREGIVDRMRERIQDCDLIPEILTNT